MTVFAAQAWPTNAHLIADVAKLGYLDGMVFDATYGDGKFWTEWQPADLITNDLHKPAFFQADYRHFPFDDGTWDSVVFDPPYKLRGTPSQPEFDAQYGIEAPMRWTDIMIDICEGAAECFRVTRKYLLVKCMDQVVSGAVRWQTDLVTQAVEGIGGHKVDRFDFLTTPQPQPEGRRQVHARRNYSTLLVFSKG